MVIISWLFLYFLFEVGEADKSCNDTLAHHPSGSSWSPVPCLTCHCHEGIKACALVECPRTSQCVYTGIPEGQCCPVCIDELPCKFEGKKYAAFEQWKYLDDEPCITCRCVRGETTCGIITCTIPPCNNPVIPTGECCPQCISNSCIFRGEFYPDSEIWNEDECLHCRCSEGTVACFLPSCQNIPESCANPTVVPNQCCPICPRTVIAERLQIVLSQIKVREEKNTMVKFNVNLNFDNDDQDRPINITGSDMWRISAWFCSNPPRQDTGVDQSLLNEQVLTREQSSVAVENGKLGDMGIIHYNTNITGFNCSQIRYMCVTFHTVDTPQITLNQAFVLSSVPTMRKLTSCRMNQYCNRKIVLALRQLIRKRQRKSQDHTL